MPHPNGGKGEKFDNAHSFDKAFKYVADGVSYRSTSDRPILADQTMTNDGKTRLIKFTGKHHQLGYDVVHGYVCESCWGYRQTCSGSYIGQCVEPLDSEIG